MPFDHKELVQSHIIAKAMVQYAAFEILSQSSIGIRAPNLAKAAPTCSLLGIFCDCMECIVTAQSGATFWLVVDK